MSWSYRIGVFFGISVRVHASFALLLAWIGYATYSRTGSILAVAFGLTAICVLFSCVVLHEYGHALMARRYGIGTRAITLYPIGGVAQLVRMPSDPRKEFMIAVAGPAVNGVLALGAWLLLALPGFSAETDTGEGLLGGSLLDAFFRINVLMAGFNLLPAFPMDGGRVLRALLAIRMPALRATEIATTVAKLMAGAMVLWGMANGNTFLAIIGVFVWLASRGELYRVQMMERARHETRGFPFSAAGGFDARTGGYGTPADPPGEWVQPRTSESPVTDDEYIIEVPSPDGRGTRRVRIVKPGHGKG